MDVKKLINWNYLGKYYGRDTAIRHDKIPNKHKEEIENLIEHIELWSKGYKLYTKVDIDQFKSDLSSKIMEILQ